MAPFKSSFHCNQCFCFYSVFHIAKTAPNLLHLVVKQPKRQKKQHYLWSCLLYMMWARAFPKTDKAAECTSCKIYMGLTINFTPHPKCYRTLKEQWIPICTDYIKDNCTFAIYFCVEHAIILCWNNYSKTVHALWILYKLH